MRKAQSRARAKVCEAKDVLFEHRVPSGSPRMASYRKVSVQHWIARDRWLHRFVPKSTYRGESVPRTPQTQNACIVQFQTSCPEAQTLSSRTSRAADEASPFRKGTIVKLFVLHFPYIELCMLICSVRFWESCGLTCPGNWTTPSRVAQQNLLGWIHVRRR